MNGSVSPIKYFDGARHCFANGLPHLLKVRARKMYRAALADARSKNNNFSTIADQQPGAVDGFFARTAATSQKANDFRRACFSKASFAFAGKL